MTTTTSATETCVACQSDTDTGLAFHGPVEWPLAGLRLLGIDHDRAVGMVSAATGSAPGTAPRHDITLGVRVCDACAKGSRLPDAMGVGAMTDLPVYGAPTA